MGPSATVLGRSGWRTSPMAGRAHGPPFATAPVRRPATCRALRPRTRVTSLAHAAVVQMAEFQEDPMTASTKTNASTPATRDRQGDAGESATGAVVETRGSEASLAELARAHEALTHELRQLVASQALEPATDGDDRERTGRMVTVARADLLEQLREQEQQQARRQLSQAARSSEDAVEGVVRSITTVVRALVPAALVRPRTSSRRRTPWRTRGYGLPDSSRSASARASGD